MKKASVYLLLILSFGYLTSCAPLVHHADPFYNINVRDYPRGRFPLIKPVEVTRDTFTLSWRLELPNVLGVDLPKSQEQEVLQVYGYTHIEELEKFAVHDGVIMAHSGYVDQQADDFFQEIFFHWFVMVPGENLTKGFHTEDEFRQYIQTLGIQDPNWQTPEDANNSFLDTGGCLDWIPDCK
jgi:hypothetical protein